MSRIDNIAAPQSAEGLFKSDYEKLRAAFTVGALISDMIDGLEFSLILPEETYLQHRYNSALPATRRRFSKTAAECAEMARVGASAIFHLKSEGRNSLGPAASRLLAEIERSGLTALRQFHD